ncbi:response regulator [Mesonia maritima]|nr:response regulator [Mesonia maritima]
MKNKLKILLIEDDMIEIMKLNRTITSSQMPHEIIEAKNGEDALNLLKNNKPLPDIILLDLNMPKMNGIEFLKILKEDAILKYLPTIVLTTSANQKDILACYEIGIAGYIIKPLKYEDYVTKLKALLEYWSLNELIKG